MERIGQTRQVPLDDLMTYPGNPRRGDVAAIMRSLEATGQYRALVVRADTMEVLAGNHTLMAMRELGYKQALCHLVNVDDRVARQIVLADNRTADLATYDQDALDALLEQCQGDWTGTGWDQAAVDGLIRALPEPVAPDSFGDPEDGMTTDYECPACHYRWSGRQSPSE